MKQHNKNVSSNNNERKSYVVDQLTCALLNLLESQAIHDISISELVNEAQVSRVSFYRNFNSKEDILAIEVKRLFSQWVSYYDNHQDLSLHEQIHSLIRHFEEHQQFYSLINERGLSYLIRDGIINTLSPEIDGEPIVVYASSFVAYTIYGWVDTWFKRGMRETSDDLAALIQLTQQ